MRRCLLLTLVLIVLVPIASAAGAAERVALVIGNGGYQFLRPLTNPGNDATAVAAKLAGLGFALVDAKGRPAKGAVLDLGGDAFLLAVKGFAQAAHGAEIALIYYAGHGMQIDGRSYLLPIDVPGSDIDLIQRNSLALDGVLKRLDGQAQLTLAVFDACREIPELAPALGQAKRDTGLGAVSFRGLGRVQQPGRQRIVAYSAAAGQLAPDGFGKPHSPYTQALLAELDRSGVEVGDLFRQVAYRLGQGQGGQEPEVLIQGVPPGRFYLLPPGAPVAPVSAPPPPSLGYLQVTVDAPGATVWLDGREVGSAGPGAPLNLTNLALGSARLEVGAPGRERVRRKIEIKAGAWTQVALALPAVAPAPEPAAPVSATVPASRKTWTEPNTGMEFVWVPGGSFQMGCDGAWARDCADDEKPAHEVAVVGFWMGKTEVTQAQWRAVMANNPSYFKECGDCPVDSVSLDNAHSYIAKLDPGGRRGLRLPTEAEWEYACRSGGKEEQYCGGNDRDLLAWSWENSGGRPKHVGGMAANGLGLYDLSGNVEEWTCSAFERKYGGAERKCSSNKGATWWPTRGGSWQGNPEVLRATSRHLVPPNYGDIRVGFRLVRAVAPQ